MSRRLVVENPDNSVEIAISEPHQRLVEQYTNDVSQLRQTLNTISEVDLSIIQHIEDIDVFNHGSDEEARNNPFTAELMELQRRHQDQTGRIAAPVFRMYNRHQKELQELSSLSTRLRHRSDILTRDINSMQPIMQPRAADGGVPLESVTVGLNLFRANRSSEPTAVPLGQRLQLGTRRRGQAPATVVRI
tara:strand:- start:37 stop:606 length:570 start_codon:yes stop_codon:yes gene_type:complete